MADIKEQPICLKYCFKLGKNAVDIHCMLQHAFSNQALRATKVKWFKHFKENRASVGDDE